MNNTENLNYPVPKQVYKVLVRCFTFNHSKYIEDALNGFAMQQTNFPFVCLVMDDASTDGEQDVIKAWMERECDMSRAETIDIPTSFVIIVPHKTNISCTFAFYLLKQNLYGTGDKKMKHIYPWRERCEYEALCEGDDYWIDSLKLQKQVDFLDAKPKYVLCHTGFKILEDSKNEFVDCFDIIRRNTRLYDNNKQIMEDILDETRYRIQTMTTLIRLSVYSNVTDILYPYVGKFLMGDTQMWLALLSLGDICFMPEVTSVYRVSTGSACHSSSLKHRIRFDLSCAEMRVCMADLFDLNEKLKKKLQSQYQKKLNLYFPYEPNYKVFIPIKFNNFLELIRYYILRLPIVRNVLRYYYIRKSI